MRSMIFGVVRFEVEESTIAAGSDLTVDGKVWPIFDRISLSLQEIKNIKGDFGGTLFVNASVFSSRTIPVKKFFSLINIYFALDLHQ